MGIQSDAIEYDLQDELSDHHYEQQKTGKDVSTQIADGDLFNFEVDAQPILQVITDKVLEIAFLEINQEEEILALRQAKERFYADIKKERERVARVEEAEIKRNENKETLKHAKRMERELAVEMHQKVLGRHHAKVYLSDLKTNAMKELHKKKLFDNLKTETIKDGILGGLLKETDEFLGVIGQINSFAMRRKSDLLNSHLKNHVTQVTKRKETRRKNEKAKVDHLAFLEREKHRLLEEKMERQKQRKLAESVFSELESKKSTSPYQNSILSCLDNLGKKEPFGLLLTSRYSRWIHW